MKQKISIVGAGGLGREVLALLRSMPEQYEVIGFFDDSVTEGELINGIPVLGTINKLNEEKRLAVVIAIGNPRIKEEVYYKISNPEIFFPVVIHPSVIMGETSSVNIGAGSILTAGVNLTVDIEIGMHVLLNLNCTVGHNAQVGDFSSVMPGVNLAGDVSIGKGVLIGSGSNIINRVSIGDHSRVGSGSVVLKNIPAHVTAVGVPANIIK